MLQQVGAKNQKIQKTITIVSTQIYSPEEIEKSIKFLLKQISSSCEDIRILAVKYILETLENKVHDEVRKVLCRPDILKLVY